MQKIDVAAYIWPSYTGDEPRTLPFWPKGNGEWETVKDAKSLFDGHLWPRKPLWGYVNEADPKVMEKEIDEATAHGVNVFIYDWYWYDGRPFLENCLNDGFLQAKNCGKMKFYLMWANHDVTFCWDRRISDKDGDTLIWRGKVTPEDFKVIGARWIEKYFSRENYYRLDGKPVLSVYDLTNLIRSFGGLKQTAKAMKDLDKAAKKAGLKGVHFQLIKTGEENFSGVDGQKSAYSMQEILKVLPFDSLTHYQYVHFTRPGDYGAMTKAAEIEWEKTASYGKTYFPHVSLGWDNTPRYRSHVQDVTVGNTPEAVEKGLEKCKAFALKTGVNLVTVNSWNEWTETSYLEPDDLYGYGYLDAVKKVFLK